MPYTARACCARCRAWTGAATAARSSRPSRATCPTRTGCRRAAPSSRAAAMPSRPLRRARARAGGMPAPGHRVRCCRWQELAAMTAPRCWQVAGLSQALRGRKRLGPRAVRRRASVRALDGVSLRRRARARCSGWSAKRLGQDHGRPDGAAPARARRGPHRLSPARTSPRLSRAAAAAAPPADAAGLPGPVRLARTRA